MVLPSVYPEHHKASTIESSSLMQTYPIAVAGANSMNGAFSTPICDTPSTLSLKNIISTEEQCLKCAVHFLSSIFLRSIPSCSASFDLCLPSTLCTSTFISVLRYNQILPYGCYVLILKSSTREVVRILTNLRLFIPSLACCPENIPH